jgi:hypothetical protein
LSRLVLKNTSSNIKLPLFYFNERAGHRQAIFANDSEFLVARLIGSVMRLKDRTPIGFGDPYGGYSGITYRHTIYVW